MNLLERVKDMFGVRTARKERTIDPVQAQVNSAVQRNELASQRAREALQEVKMSQTLSDVVGRMK